MSFQIGDQVVHPAYGIGRIVGIVTKRFVEAEASRYYEIGIQQSTVWVPVEGSTPSGLRPLTSKHELARYRGVLRSHPALLTPDSRQRRLDILNRLKVGLFQTRCEVIRDLTAQGWHKALNEADSAALRKTREGVCQEWAAAEGVSVQQATQEIDALLLEARKAYRA